MKVKRSSHTGYHTKIKLYAIVRVIDHHRWLTQGQNILKRQMSSRNNVRIKCK